MQPLRRLLKSRRASVVATQKRNNPAASWFARGAKWSKRLTRFQRQTSLFGLLQLPCLYEVQQSACQQKGTPEFFQDENPTPFVDVSVRYTAESRPDHRFLAHDRPHSCVCYSCVWMVLCPALIAGNEHFSILIISR